VVHVSPLAQFGIAVHAVHALVPVPRKPTLHAGHTRLVPLVTLQVSTAEQFAIVPQSEHTLLLSYVPTPHGAQVPVPSPT
jgi:hypothetical protein